MMFHRWTALAALMLLSTTLPGGCYAAVARVLLEGNGTVVPQVSNGLLAKEGQFPFVAALFDNGPSWDLNHFCGGTLVQPWVVMTAAHCVINNRGRPSAPSYVRVGMTDTLDKQAAQRTVTKVYLHQRYNGRSDANDVALLLLSEPVNGIPVAQLAPSNTRLVEGQKLEVAGFGGTEQLYVSRALRYTTVNYISYDKCRRFYGWIHKTSVCAGGPTTSDACAGDSGGPLLISSNPPVQVGIVSWGQQGCGGRKNRYGVYTKVSSIRNWAIKTTRKAARRGRKLRRLRRARSG